MESPPLEVVKKKLDEHLSGMIKEWCTLHPCIQGLNWMTREVHFNPLVLWINGKACSWDSEGWVQS